MPLWKYQIVRVIWDLWCALHLHSKLVKCYFVSFFPFQAHFSCLLGSSSECLGVVGACHAWLGLPGTVLLHLIIRPFHTLSHLRHLCGLGFVDAPFKDLLGSKAKVEHQDSEGHNSLFGAIQCGSQVWFLVISVFFLGENFVGEPFWESGSWRDLENQKFSKKIYGWGKKSCMKSYETWDIVSINWCRISSVF